MPGENTVFWFSFFFPAQRQMPLSLQMVGPQANQWADRPASCSETPFLKSAPHFHLKNSRPTIPLSPLPFRGNCSAKTTWISLYLIKNLATLPRPPPGQKYRWNTPAFRRAQASGTPPPESHPAARRTCAFCGLHSSAARRFPKHPLPGTGRVHENRSKYSGKCSADRPGVSLVTMPFLTPIRSIFSERSWPWQGWISLLTKNALSLHFPGDLVLFHSRRRAQIQYPHPRTRIQILHRRHGAGLLNIVDARLVVGMFPGCRAMASVRPRNRILPAPGHLFQLQPVRAKKPSGFPSMDSTAGPDTAFPHNSPGKPDTPLPTSFHATAKLFRQHFFPPRIPFHPLTVDHLSRKTMS